MSHVVLPQTRAFALEHGRDSMVLARLQARVEIVEQAAVTTLEIAGRRVPPDEDVLRRAQEELRTVVTFDSDFGMLAFRAGSPAACGVVLLRLNGPTPDIDNERALEALTSRDDWAGHFVVIDDERIHIRPPP